MKKSKSKRNRTALSRSVQRLVSRCSEERILQLSNDGSEDIESGTVQEWRAVALYFRNLFDKERQSVGALRMSLAALNIAEGMRGHALREIAKWLKGEAANAPHRTPKRMKFSTDNRTARRSAVLCSMRLFGKLVA